MKAIEQWSRQQKQRFTPKKKDFTQPVACWSEPDLLNNQHVNALVVILRTKGCRWAAESGCTMCGYFNDSAWQTVTNEQLQHQWDKALEKYTDQAVIKIFTSGSFLDKEEIPEPVLKHILTTVPSSVHLLQVESRPEYVNEDIVPSVSEYLGSTEFRVGIGLETSNDITREHTINKGFSFQQFQHAADLLHQNKHSVKTYVLLKPPFLTEQEAINDAVSTIKQADEYTDVFSLNPANVQRHTIVECLWKKNKYRPPWLWSVIEVLQQGKTLTKKRIQCDIAGGGSKRGAHNCKQCDKQVLQHIKTFSLNQNPTMLNKVKSCSCHEEWLDQLDLEALTFGSLVDFSRVRI